MRGPYKAKICGTTSLEDARLAAREGADCFGVVTEVAFSARSLSLEEARPLFASPPLPAVALVFRMEPERVETLIRALHPFAVQFLHPEDPDRIAGLKRAHPSVEFWQSVHLPEAGAGADEKTFRETVKRYLDAGVDSLLYDTVAVSRGVTKFGGTGRTSDWDLVRRLMRSVPSPVPVWLAGGIRPGNVGEALDAVDPDGIDLCSGVEARPGKKDPEKVRALMETIRERSRHRGKTS